MNTPPTHFDAKKMLNDTAKTITDIVKGKGYVVRGIAQPVGAYWIMRLKDNQRLTREILQRQFKDSPLMTCGFGWDHIDGFYLAVQLRGDK